MKTKLQEALTGIMRRSDEIVAMAENRERGLATLFSPKENNATIETCVALLDAVATTTAEEIAAERELIENCRERVMAANAAISLVTTRNPLMMNTVQSCENIVFDFLLADSPKIIQLAKTARHLKWVVRMSLKCGFTDLGQQLEKSCDTHPLKVEIVRPEKTKKTESAHPRQAPFMREQIRIFKDYLDKHPVCASYSLITRARQCWNEHKNEWDKAARNKTGYSSHKTLARTVQYQN